MTKEIGGTDLYGLSHKNNSRLTFVLTLSLLLNLVLGGLLVVNRTPQIKLLRLYENIEQNSTTGSVLSESINYTDLMLLTKYVIEHYDLKSSNSLINYKKLLSVSCYRKRYISQIKKL